MTLQYRIASFFAYMSKASIMAFLIWSIIIIMCSPELLVPFGKITVTAAFVSGVIAGLLSTGD